MLAQSISSRDSRLDEMPQSKEIQELVATLKRHYEKVKNDSAFLTLKQGEAQSGSELTLMCYMAVKEQHEFERSLLGGHALMVQHMFHEKKLKLDTDTHRLLNEIRNHLAVYLH